MRFRLLWLFAGLASLLLLGQSTFAEERYREFLQGLRDRQYFDYALLYLDQLADRPSVPDEIRQIIPYEKAVTLRENAKVIRNVEKNFETLDKALAFLDQFARESPDHPLSADANLDRAQILLQRAEAEITQAKSANKASRGDFQRKAREQIEKARLGLKLAFDRHQEALQKLPAYIDEKKEPTLHAQRAQVERSLILEALNLAKCTYEEAQTHDAGSRDFKKILERAVTEFEKVHQQYRNQVGGLHARVWQGRCFEELGDTQKALGIYNELLDTTADDAAMQSLKAQTLLFKLSCLHTREEYQPIVDLAEEWQKKNPGEARTQVGLGIQWQQARAYEALGDKSKQNKTDQERFYRQARTIAQHVNRFPGEYRDSSLTMVQRMQTKLGGKQRKPEDFESAYALARQSYNLAQDVKRDLDAATKAGNAEDISRLTKDWNNELNEAARNFDLASTLITRRDNQKEVAAARLVQGYTQFFLRRNYEAAILGRYIARTTTGEDDGGTAIEAAYLSMAAYVQAYNDNKAEFDKKQDDMQLVVQAADLLVARWPESEKANEARMVLGRLYTAAKKPVEAAEWFRKIPENDPKYAEAQLAAGQAYWVAYGSAARLPAEMRPSTDQLTQWKDTSEEYLKRGIQKITATLPGEGSMPQELASAKIYMAEILLSQGKEADAAAMLQNDPQSLIKAVAVADESKRPEKGIQSRSVARSVYTLLLRSQIGMGVDKLNDARATMRKLESIAAGDAKSDLTELYVGLGRVLKVELERFRTNGETQRYKKLMTAFESFLDDMSTKQDGQTLGSLSWIGETYFALAEIDPDSPKAKSYYDKSATAFQTILKRAQSDPSFATEEQLLNVKVRMIRCQRLKKDFANAESLLTEVLKARSNDLRTQVEGASLYQDWGTSDDKKNLVLAIAGNPEIGLWGWGGIAKRIQQQKDYYERPDLVDEFLDARYNVTHCRYLYARTLSGPEKQKTFETCLKELVGSATIIKSIPDEKRGKLNDLYREVLLAAAKPVTDLPGAEGMSAKKARPSDQPANGDVKTNSPAEKTAPQPAGEKPAATQAAAAHDSTTWYAFLGLMVIGAATIGAVIYRSSQKHVVTARVTEVRDPHPLEFTGISVDDPEEPELPYTTLAPIPRQKPQTTTTSVPPKIPPSAAAPKLPPAAAGPKAASPAPQQRPAPPTQPRPAVPGQPAKSAPQSAKGPVPPQAPAPPKPAPPTTRRPAPPSDPDAPKLKGWPSFPPPPPKE